MTTIYTSPKKTYKASADLAEQELLDWYHNDDKVMWAVHEHGYDGLPEVARELIDRVYRGEILYLEGPCWCIDWEMEVENGWVEVETGLTYCGIRFFGPNFMEK